MFDCTLLNEHCVFYIAVLSLLPEMVCLADEKTFEGGVYLLSLLLPRLSFHIVLILNFCYLSVYLFPNKY